MIRNLLGAAAVAAVVCAFVPAQAARVGVGCSGENLGKTEGTVEGMADGPAKYMAEREIAQAQDALLKGDMRGCGVHLSRAANAGTLAQPPYAGTMAQGIAPYQAAPQGSYQGGSYQGGSYQGGPYQAPAEAQYQAQPQWGWQAPQSGY
jgi:hypothetical protein